MLSLCSEAVRGEMSYEVHCPFSINPMNHILGLCANPVQALDGIRQLVLMLSRRITRREVASINLFVSHQRIRVSLDDSDELA